MMNQKKTNLWQVIKSILAAMLGVQSTQNAKRDFEQPHPMAYVIVGLIAVTLFVCVLLVVVRWVLAT